MRDIFDIQTLMDDNNVEPLEGSILVSTSYLGKSIFERSLIYVCAHDVAGSAGIIFNNVMDSITKQQILNRNGIQKIIKHDKTIPIFYGGPVNEERSVALRYTKVANDFESNMRISVETNIDLFLRNVALGKIKDKFILAKGVCGWAPGQLEEEIDQNAWIVMQLQDPEFIFSQRIKNKWDKAVKDIGVQNFANLVSYNGSA